MTVRNAARIMVGPRTGRLEIVLGRRQDGTAVATLKPQWPSSSGVVTLETPSAVYDLIHELETAADYLEDDPDA